MVFVGALYGMADMLPKYIILDLQPNPAHGVGKVGCLVLSKVQQGREVSREDLQGTNR